MLYVIFSQILLVLEMKKEIIYRSSLNPKLFRHSPRTIIYLWNHYFGYCRSLDFIIDIPIRRGCSTTGEVATGFIKRNSSVENCTLAAAQGDSGTAIERDYVASVFPSQGSRYIYTRLVILSETLEGILTESSSALIACIYLQQLLSDAQRPVALILANGTLERRECVDPTSLRECSRGCRNRDLVGRHGSVHREC